MGDKVKVQEQELTRAADSLVFVRGDLRRADDRADQAANNAATKLNKGGGGWQVSTGIGRFRARWQDQVKYLHQELQGTSDKLHESRKSYTRQEQRERANYDKIMKDFG